MREITVAVLGAGNVGLNFIKILQQNEDLFLKHNIRIKVAPILIKDLSKKRGAFASEIKFTDKFEEIGHCDILVELIGGKNDALKFILPTLKQEKSVIIANKALLAESWHELKPFAEQGLLFYEAAVLAGTPIIGSLSGVLQSSNLVELHTLLSSTCNFIVSEMEKGIDYQKALVIAQKQGIAENLPTLDVSGLDSAHKLTILARLTIDPDFSLDNVEIRGIEHLTQKDFQLAKQKSAKIRLLASLIPKNNHWKAIVRPVFLPNDHILSKSQRNILLFRGNNCGELIFIGNTGGPKVTASAVLGDLFCALTGHPGHRPAIKRNPAGYQFEDFLEI